MGSVWYAHLGASDDKAAARLEVVNGLVVQILGRNHGFDHLMAAPKTTNSKFWRHGLSVSLLSSRSLTIYLLLEHRLLFLQGNVVVVLDGDHDGVNSLGDHGTVLLVVMHRHLRHGRSQTVTWDSRIGRCKSRFYSTFPLLKLQLGNLDINFDDYWKELCPEVKKRPWHSLQSRWLMMPMNEPKKKLLFPQRELCLYISLLIWFVCWHPNKAPGGDPEF